MLNGHTVHEGYKQYSLWKQELTKSKLITKPVVTDVLIGSFKCSSSEVVNQVLDDVGRLIWPERGLISIEIFNFCDRNTLMKWPFSQLVAKSQNLEILKICGLYTSAENRSMILDFCGEVATTSNSLKTLDFNTTKSSKSDGEKLWSTLADADEFDSLTDIVIRDEKNWFEEDCEECIALLLVVLARQTNLTSFYMV